MARVTYLGPFDAVDLPGGLTCRRGESIDVPDDLANGTPATEDHPGRSGLLAQSDSWQPASPAKTPRPAAAAAAEDPKE